MKTITFIFLLFILCINSNAQINKYIGEKNGKYGILDNREEFFMVKPMFDEAHALLHGYMQGGYVGSKGDVWYYYSFDYELLKDSLEFDQFLGNSIEGHNWVLKNDTVFMYYFEDHSIKKINSDSVLYDPNQLIFFQNSDNEWGAIWPDGTLKIKPQWMEFYSPMHYQLKLQIPILFTNKGNNGGAFYDNKGNLVLAFDNCLDYLGNQRTPYVRLYKNKLEENQRVALGTVNVANKKIDMLTDYDFTSLVVHYQKTPQGVAIARGFMPDSSMVLVYPNGDIQKVNW